MLNLLFLIYSFFPINQNTNNLSNPYIKIDNRLDIPDKNNISYTLNINRNLDRSDIKIYDLENNISGNYRYKFISIYFNYQKAYEYFNYKTDDINFIRDIKKDELELYLGIFKYNISLKAIFNINFHLEDKLKYGAYLAYHFNVQNIKYKIYFSKYKKEESHINKLSSQDDSYIFPYRYNKSVQILGFNLNIYNKLKLKFKNTITDTKTPDLDKKDFTIEEISKINNIILKTKLDFKNYAVYFNYLEKFITANIKNELDDLKFSKLIVKEYDDYTYNLGIILKKLTKLNVDIYYQKINSYFFGNIESWPFTENDNSWVGGRLNFSAKPKYKRYMVRIKNKITLFNQKLSISPEIFYDYLIFEPNFKSYEAGYFGIGKQNEFFYNTETFAHLLHLSANFNLKFQNLKLNLFISQIIPIKINGNNENNKPSGEIKTLEGFQLKFLINYNF